MRGGCSFFFFQCQLAVRQALMLCNCLVVPVHDAPNSPGVPKPRIAKELQRLQRRLPLGVQSVENVTGKGCESWQVVIDGPSNSPYEGGSFLLDIDFPELYPFDAPVVYFSTKIYHVNVDPISGEICCSDFQWEAASTISHLLEAICAMLDVPDDSPSLVPREYNKIDLPPEKEVIRLFKQDREEYERIARQWTELYAS